MVEIPFSDWDKKKGTLKTKTGDTTIKNFRQKNRNSHSKNKGRKKTFKQCPYGCFWIVWKDKNIENVVLAKRGKEIKKEKRLRLHSSDEILGINGHQMP